YDYSPFTGKHLQLQNLILPAITLGIRPLAIIAQLTRSSMLDVLNQNYIRTAYAKGLSKKRVIWKHALRNALNPVMTAITGWFAELLAGAFFVEYIFGWNGIGKVTVDALEKLDFPVVMGSVLITATFFVLVNMLADILYGVLNPRVRMN
ncbi:MAG: ABC transporter permease, partial [Bacteroidota bacterium]